MNALQAFSRDLEELVARTSPAVVGVEHRRGQGSGVVLSNDGYVLSNAHVVGGSASTRLRLAEGDTAPARLVGVDERTDLAVLRTEAANLTSLPFVAANQTRVGQIVLAIGNPLRFERSVSLGVVSAIDRTLPGPRGGLEGLIQTDAAINPGNSGGPLVDMEGRVVGISTAMIPYAQGIGFAVPAHTASWVAAVLMRQGEVRRPYLGIAAIGESLGSKLAPAVGQSRGVHVRKVEAASPASASGLREGDVVVSANGQPTTSVDDLQRAMVLNPNPDVELVVWRRGRRQTIRARPERRQEAA